MHFMKINKQNKDFSTLHYWIEYLMLILLSVQAQNVNVIYFLALY